MDRRDNQLIYKYWGRAVASRYLYVWVPYLRYVGLNGSLAQGVASVNSDIDLMVVAEPGHIFTVRFFVVTMTALVGIKRTQNKIAGRLCINYFVTSDNLDIKPHNKKVAQWYKNMVPMVDDDISNLKSQKSKLHHKNQNFHNLIKERNRWMRKYRVPINKNQLLFNQRIEPLGEPWVSVRRCIEFALFLIGDALEIVLKNIQIAKIKRHPLTATNPEKIIISDKELMFHPRKN